MAKILVVDDSFMAREGLFIILGQVGHTVFLAVDGVEGLRLARAEKPDLILSDLAMPNLDGASMVRQLRQEGVTTPVIVMSVNSDADTCERVLEAGANEFLSKGGSTTADILAAINRLLAS